MTKKAALQRDLARMQADLHAVATALLQQLQPAPAGVDENVKTDETGETDETEGTKEEAR